MSALEVCLFKDMEKFYLQIFYDAKEAIRHANNNSYFIKWKISKILNVIFI